MSADGVTTRVAHVQSRDNKLIKLIKRLATHNTAYRKQGQVWLEGDHLCRAALLRGRKPALAVFAESFWLASAPAWAAQLAEVVLLPDALFAECSSLESPARMGFVIDLPAEGAARHGVAAVVLDRVQDAGNVGSILRSAGAFGFHQVLALGGTAALWSPKVLRAGMGAHFGLHLVEGLSVQDVVDLGVPLLVTSSHQGEMVHGQALPWPCAWAFGHEGQGVDDALARHATTWCRIAQPGGEESLNVAAAAAICLHASAVSHLG